MKQAVHSGKFRVRALREMITGGMMLSVIGFIDVDESVRISPDVLPVPISRFAKYLVDQPNIKGPVQIEYLSQLCKRLHEQVVHERLQLSDRRSIWQGWNQRKYQQSAIDRPGMSVLLASVVREIPQIVDIVLNRLLPDPVRFLPIPVHEPSSDRRTIGQRFDLDMIHCRHLA